MDYIAKTIDVEDGGLFTIQGDSRFLVSKCGAKVEIREHGVSIPIMGKGRIIDSRSVILPITFDHKPEINDIYSVDGFQFCGKLRRMDGLYEQVTLNNCMLLDDLDMEDAGTCTFEVKCSRNMLNKLKTM